MTWFFVGIGVFVLLIVLWVASKGRLYGRIFSTEHYAELADAMPAVKAAACDMINQDPVLPPTEDQRVVITSAGIAILYTISHKDDEFTHHFSISIAGRLTPYAVGGSFTLYIARLLGLDESKLEVGVSEGNVFHTEWRCSEAEQNEFSSRTVASLTPEEAGELFASCIDDKQNLEFHAFHSGLNR